ncbi:MAG: YlbF family regulator [Bacillota bacterium]
MSIDIKAKELADAVKESEEFKNLTSAHARLKIDISAQDLIRQIQKLQEKAFEAQRQGTPADKSIIDQLKALEVTAQQNDTLNKLFKAQEKFNMLMHNVSEKISSELYK